MVKFSIQSMLTPEAVVRRLNNGSRPTDEMLLEAFGHIDPPILDSRDSAAIRRILGRKRGRPPGDAPGREQVAMRLQQVQRDDVPERFLDALTSRISTGNGLTELERGRSAHAKAKKLERNSLIRGLYRYFYRALETASSDAEHPILGSFKLPTDEPNRSAQALSLVGDAMRQLTLYPPSPATMFNIVSKKRRLNFVSQSRRTMI